MRVSVAKLLVRLAARVLSGPDDRLALLNIKRYRSRPGSADAGRIHAFVTMTDEPKTAPIFSPDEVPRSIGWPVPALLARLAGYKTKPIA